MQDLRVAAVSTRNTIGRQNETIRGMESWCRKARDAGAEFVLFPELNVSGYFYSTETFDLSEPVPGPSTERIVELAGELGITIAFGLLENDADVVYNTQVIVDGGGILGKQRKIHMPGQEYLYWRGGFEIRTIDIGKARVGIAICYDALFPEMARTLFVRGAEILVMPFAYNTPGPRRTLPARDVGVMTYRAHCHSNGCFGILANNAGRRRKTAREGSAAVFPGWAGVFDPMGNVLAWTEEPGNGETMVVADLQARRLRDRRSDRYFIPRCLRPHLYRSIDDDGPAGAGRDATEGT